jgi:hypothetical protein
VENLTRPREWFAYGLRVRRGTDTSARSPQRLGRGHPNQRLSPLDAFSQRRASSKSSLPLSLSLSLASLKDIEFLLDGGMAAAPIDQCI